MPPTNPDARLLGRTNLEFPSVWLSLSAPRSPVSYSELVGAALEAKVPIDITSQPALWGGHLRGTEAFLTCLSTTDYLHASDDKRAADFTQAHLIEVLSGIGREHIDIYFVRVTQAAEEYQITGLLEALENARQEGHIRFIGVACDGPSLATLGLWQFHDAFDVILVPRNHYDDESYQTLNPLASQRRVGVVTSRPLNWGHGLPFVAMPDLWRQRNLTQSFYGMSLAQAVLADLSREHPVMVGVRTPKEIQQAMEVAQLRCPDGIKSMLEPFREAFDSDDFWVSLAESGDKDLASSAKRRSDAVR